MKTKFDEESEDIASLVEEIEVISIVVLFIIGHKLDVDIRRVSDDHIKPPLLIYQVARRLAYSMNRVMVKG